MNVKLMVFLKKKKIGTNEPFWAQKLRILMTLDPFQGVFKDFAE